MTKEELEKEAEDWLSITDNHLNDERTHFLSESEYAEQAYLAGAEPREKQIQIDAEQIRALQRQNGELTDRVQELEAQIEKVKHYLDYDIPHDLINEATTKIWRMLK